jgi:hypothetical protein
MACEVPKRGLLCRAPAATDLGRRHVRATEDGMDAHGLSWLLVRHRVQQGVSLPQHIYPRLARQNIRCVSYSLCRVSLCISLSGGALVG